MSQETFCLYFFYLRLTWNLVNYCADNIKTQSILCTENKQIILTEETMVKQPMFKQERDS